MEPQKIEHILSRGVSDVIVRAELIKKLASGKKLRIKLGIDPTGSDLTLGHAVVFKKLADFQKAGHQICFLFGNFTAKIGDPTGKDKTRKILTDEEIKKNSEQYLAQAGKIIDIDNCEIFHNHDWLSKMNFEDVLELAGTFTVSQMLERDMFQKRMTEGKQINLIEFFYPLMQGYDSVPMETDIELGGNDQLFNMLAARPIQKHFGKPQQNVVTTKLLVGTDGKEKMSKSLGNYIALNDEPNEIFGKIMSIPDHAMAEYFECLTDHEMTDVNAWIEEDPRGAKIKLGQDIVTWLCDEASAEKAKEAFAQKFVKKEVPDEMPEFTVSGEIGILDLISKTCGFAQSNGEARRLITGGAVSIDGEKVSDPTMTVSVTDPMVLKVGKRKFGRVTKA